RYGPRRRNQASPRVHVMFIAVACLTAMTQNFQRHRYLPNGNDPELPTSQISGSCAPRLCRIFIGNHTWLGKIPGPYAGALNHVASFIGRRKRRDVRGATERIGTSVREGLLHVRRMQDTGVSYL